jgi:CheY-like chemotaxis protein
MNDVVIETERLIRRLIGEDIEFVAELGPDLGLILADPGQLTQVILNLAINARDAMPDGGRLTLRTSQVEVAPAEARRRGDIESGPYLRLTIADTGHGMDTDTQAKIFDPFFTTKEVGKGTGLGLSTVHGIVQQSGGFITVESKPGQGAVFHIWLPQVSASEDEPATAGATAVTLTKTDPASLTTRTILVVEDEASVRQLVKRILARAGYTLCLASDGTEALELSQTHPEPIDLLLTDMILPGDLNGYQLAQQLLAQRPGLKVIYTSGYTDRAIIQDQVIAAGLTFLQKPFPPQLLLETVRRTLMTATGDKPSLTPS